MARDPAGSITGSAQAAGCGEGAGEPGRGAVGEPVAVGGPLEPAAAARVLASGPRRAVSVITRCTSSGWTWPTARPDSSRVAVSAITAPTPRPSGASSGHCPATTAAARARSAA